MKKIDSTFFLLFFLTTTFFHFSQTQPCGKEPLLANEVLLNRSQFLLSQEKLGQALNGQSLTVFGWIQMTSSTIGIHPFLQLSMKRNQNEAASTFPVTLSPFASIYYDKIKDSTDGILKFEFAFNASNYEVIEQPVNLRAGEWLFLVYSADYSKNQVKMSISNQRDINLNLTKTVDFPSFQIRQELEIDIGCTPDDRNLPDSVNSCLLGKARDFGYVLSSFPDTSLLYTLSENRASGNKLFLFDSFTNTKEETVSVDSSKTPYEVEGVRKAVKGNNLNNVNKLSFDQGQTVIIRSAVGINTGQLSSSPTVFIKFKYQEPLPDNFLLMHLRRTDGVMVMELRLIKEGDNRKAEVKTPNNSITINSTATLKQNTIQELSVSVIHRAGKSGVYLNIGNESITSQFIDNTLDGRFDVVFFGNKEEFLGETQLIQVNLLDSAAGVVFSGDSNRKEICSSSCQKYSNINSKGKSCLSCKTGFVVNSATQQCTSSCPQNTYNESGSCLTCRNNVCQRITGSYFEAKKIGLQKIQMTQKRDIPNFNNRYNDNFILKVTNSTLDKDYTYTVIPSAQNKSAVFDVKGINNYDLTNKEMSINFRSNSTLVGEEKTLLRNSPPFRFVAGPIVDIIPPVNPVNPVDTSSSSSESNERIEKRNEKVEKSFKVLGIFGFIFMVIAMAVGLLGILFCCEYTDKPKFLYQKWIQTFIMFQFVAFWTFYNAYLPHNLLSYLNALFGYSTGWHDIFNKAAKDNNDQARFREKLVKNTHRRFYEEEVSTHFVLSYGFPLLLTLFGLTLYGVIKALVYFGSKKKLNKNEIGNSRNRGDIHISTQVVTTPSQSSIESGYMGTLLNHFEWKLLVTLFLIFIVEVTAFICYNFYGPSFAFGVYTFSFIFAIIWAIIIVALVIYVFIYPFGLNKVTMDELDGRNHFIYEGLRLIGLRKNFQGIQYLHYMFFSIILVLAYQSRLTQIIITGFLLLFFVLYVVGMQPADERFDRIEQTISHLLLLIAFIFLLVLVIDDNPKNIKAEDRWILGYFVAILTFLLFFWNMCVILYKVFSYIASCMKMKKSFTGQLKPDDQRNDGIEESMALVNSDYDFHNKDRRGYNGSPNRHVTSALGVDRKPDLERNDLDNDMEEDIPDNLRSDKEFPNYRLNENDSRVNKERMPYDSNDEQKIRETKEKLAAKINRD